MVWPTLFFPVNSTWQSLEWRYLNFVLEIFKFKYDKVFVRYSASISKFEWFEQPWNAVMWGFNPIYKTLRKIHAVSHFTQLLTNSNIWDVILKSLGPFEHVHELKSKWFKYCRPEPYSVLFYSMKQKYFVSDMKYFVVMDTYFFIYNVLGRETFILCST